MNQWQIRSANDDEQECVERALPVAAPKKKCSSSGKTAEGVAGQAQRPVEESNQLDHRE
jgi:hypothetical protein